MGMGFKCKDVIEAYRSRIDEHGLVQPDGGTSHNGIRFTAEYVVALVRCDDQIPKEEAKRILTAIKSCQAEPGLYHRFPGAFTLQEGPDDYVGLGLISYYLNTNIADEILAYGKKTLPRYNFNNINPGKFNKSAWLGRQGQLICHLYYGSTQDPPWYLRLWHRLAVLKSAFGEKDDQDNWVLTWMLVKIMPDGYLNNLVKMIWINRFKKHHPKGIGQVLCDYFNQTTHPHSTYLDGEFGL